MVTLHPVMQKETQNVDRHSTGTLVIKEKRTERKKKSNKSRESLFIGHFKENKVTVTITIDILMRYLKVQFRFRNTSSRPFIKK